MLNRSDNSGHRYLIPNLRGKSFNVSLMSMMFVVGLSYMGFVRLRLFPSPSLLSVFIMKGC